MIDGAVPRILGPGGEDVAGQFEFRLRNLQAQPGEGKLEVPCGIREVLVEKENCYTVLIQERPGHASLGNVVKDPDGYQSCHGGLR